MASADSLSTSSSDFYLTLPSNASFSHYPDNTLANFTVMLDPPLDLQGQYEVGLCEISYPRSWLNINSDQYYLTMEDHNLLETYDIYLPPGHYDSIEHVVSLINQRIPKQYKPTGPPPILNVNKTEWKDVFSYKTQISKVSLSLSQTKGVHMSDKLRDVLGFTRNHYIGGHFSYGERVANVNHGLECMYVYLDLIEDRVVGDTRAPLLRMVPLSRFRSATVFHTFLDVHYVPIKYNSFDRLTVNIRNGAGDLIPFDRGEVILTLRVRRRGLP
jgi:hypothetical protein